MTERNWVPKKCPNCRQVGTERGDGNDEWECFNQNCRVALYYGDKANVT